MPTTKKKTTKSKQTTAKKKVAAKTATVKKKAPAKTAASKKTSVNKQPAAKKSVAKKATAKKTPAKKAEVKKAPAQKAAAKKAATPKASASSVTTAKPTAKKAPAKKSSGVTAKSVRKSGAGSYTPVEGFAAYELKKGEEYMNEPQLKHFRDLLVAWKRQLMEEVDRTVHHMQDEAANFPDPNDRATQESEFSLELRTRDRERKLIKKIDESIANLDSGEYGYCESCGVEIGVRRLEARPTATLCIDCKTLDEIREKQMG